MAHVQKPEFAYRRNGRVNLNLGGGVSVQSTTGIRVVCISGSNAGYTMFRDSVKSTGYPLHLNRRGGGGRQFSRLLAAEVCASAVVMLDTPCSEVVWRVLATQSIRQFHLHFFSRASPCAIIFHLEYTYVSISSLPYYINLPPVNQPNPTDVFLHVECLKKCKLTKEVPGPPQWTAHRYSYNETN